MSAAVWQRLAQQFVKRAIIGLKMIAYPLVLLYWRIARPSSTSVVVFLQHHDQVLLVRNSYGTRRWTPPGGSVQRGESPAAAARREVREEVGIEPGALVYHGRVFGIVSGRRDTTWVFSAPVAETRVHVGSWEIAEARWVPREQAAALGVRLPEDIERQPPLRCAAHPEGR